MDGLGGRAPRLGQVRGPGAAARSPSSRHSGNLKTATPSPESHPSGDSLFQNPSYRPVFICNLNKLVVKKEMENCHHSININADCTVVVTETSQTAK